MPKYIAYKLTFTSPLHISAGGFAAESTEVTIHSDTLFSAICSAMQTLYGEAVVSEFLTKNVLISSCFPYLDEEYYFPRPLVPNKLKEKSEHEPIKKLDASLFKKQKKQKYLAQSDFQSALEGTFDVATFAQKFENQEPPTFCKTQELPRVTIDRITNASSIFNFAQVTFNKSAGLYFMADFSGIDAETQKRFAASLRFLGDEGIGADNTVGKGFFEVVEDKIDLQVPTDAEHYLLTSLYSPSNDELDKIDVKNCYYDYTTRNGWTSAGDMNKRRLSLRMLVAGSVLNIKAVGDNKKVLDKETISTNFDVVRYGKTIALPIKINL
jgi:CRISPR-associated protein Csm4